MIDGSDAAAGRVGSTFTGWAGPPDHAERTHARVAARMRASSSAGESVSKNARR